MGIDLINLIFSCTDEKKQMKELYKKTEKEHIETIAVMQKCTEDLESTLKPT